MKKKITALLLSLMLIIPSVFTVVIAAEDDGFVISISDGEIISKEKIITFFSPDPNGCEIKLDGEKINAKEMNEMELCFTVGNSEYKDAEFRCGKKSLGKVIPNTTAEQSIKINSSVIGNGKFSIQFLPTLGNGTVLDTSKVYGTYNLDDLNFNSIYLLIATGEKMLPTTVTYHYPIEGKAGTRDEEKTYTPGVIAIGDGWNSATGKGGMTPNVPISVTFNFDISDKTEFLTFQNGKVLCFNLNTIEYPDGEHEFTFSSASESKKMKVVFDNTAPKISANISAGDLLGRNDVITVTTDDENAKTTVTIDGKNYFGKPLGNVVMSNTSKTHLLMAKSTDKCDNTSYLAVEFYLSDGDADEYHYVAQAKPSEISFTDGGKVLTVEKLQSTNSDNVFTVKADDNKKIVLEYNGISSEKNHIRLNVLDVKKNEYVPVRTFPSGDTVYIEYDVSDDFVKDGVVTFKAEEYVYESESNTMIWISDTQYYTRFADLICEYECDIDYYIDLYNKGEAGFFIHTGDVADQYTPAADARAQMKAASELHAKLDSLGIPYGIVDGNHDAGHALADSKYFTEVFGSKRFDGTSWFYGSLDNNTHHYDLVTLGGYDFLLLWIGYGVEADPDVIAWANMVLDKYPERNAIILTHAYLDVDNDWVLNYNDTTSYDHSRAPEIWENYVVPHDNVVAVFCGHTPGVGRNLRKVDENRSVWEILADYQFVNVQNPLHVENGMNLDGEGYLRIVSFDGEKMTQKTYSPFLDDWNYFAADKEEFTVDLHLEPSVRKFESEIFNAYAVKDTFTDTQIPVISGDIIIVAEEYDIKEADSGSFPAESESDTSEAESGMSTTAIIIIALIGAMAVVTIIIIIVKKRK